MERPQYWTMNNVHPQDCRMLVEKQLKSITEFCISAVSKCFCFVGKLCRRAVVQFGSLSSGQCTVEPTVNLAIRSEKKKKINFKDVLDFRFAKSNLGFCGSCREIGTTNCSVHTSW